MSDEKIRGFCKDCNKFVVAFRSTPNHVLHLLLSIFTLGFWVMIWILLSIKIGGWRCSECGSKRISQTSSTLAIVLFAILIVFILSVIVGGTKQYIDKKNINTQASKVEVKPEPEKIAISEPLKKAEPQITQESKPEPRPEPESINQNKTWVGNWGNGIISTVTLEPCQNSEFTNQGYSYALSSTIPIARLKLPSDAYAISGDKAITVIGCWFKKEGGIVHAKMKRKKDGKTWEQDFKLDDGNWLVK